MAAVAAGVLEGMAVGEGPGGAVLVHLAAIPHMMEALVAHISQVGQRLL